MAEAKKEKLGSGLLRKAAEMLVGHNKRTEEMAEMMRETPYDEKTEVDYSSATYMTGKKRKK